MRQGWERDRAEIALDRAALAKLLAPVFPGAAVTRFERVSGGLVNTNFKVVPEAQAAPLLLRIYQRDAAQGLKEAALIRQLGPCVPVPELFHAAENNPVTGHAYSILSWVEAAASTRWRSRAKTCARPGEPSARRWQTCTQRNTSGSDFWAPT